MVESDEELCIESQKYATNIYVIAGEVANIVVCGVVMIIAIKVFHGRRKYKSGLHGNFKVDDKVFNFLAKK